MPSLHLDIPSIDWIERPPRADRSGGAKPAPVSDLPTPGGQRGERPSRGDTPERDRWPGEPAGVPA